MPDDRRGGAEARRRRAWALAHHPDRGGDPATFMAGLAALDQGRPADPDDVPAIYRRRRGLAGWLGRDRPRPPPRNLR